ncbi:MAG: PTS system mannose/fructose/sorbose family transporter subunit IID [Gemmatimonadales bacterium]
MSSGRLRAFVRLLTVQGAWNYERMTGVGLGHAAEPLLEDLKSADPARHAEAAVRSAEYFNSHPYLAGLALGALVRAEYDFVPGPQIARLRAALCSPLGALGDQLYWIGLVPALMAAGIVAVVAGLGLWSLAAILVTYNFVRLWTGAWALNAGLKAGARVGTAIGNSWLPGAASRAGRAAGLLVGLALPLAADWLLDGESSRNVVLAVVTMLAGLGLAWQLGPRITAVRFGLLAIGIAATLAWRIG